MRSWEKEEEPNEQWFQRKIRKVFSVQENKDQKVEKKLKKNFLLDFLFIKEGISITSRINSEILWIKIYSFWSQKFRSEIIIVVIL